MKVEFLGEEIVDWDSGTTYRAFLSEQGQVGYRCECDGRVEFFYLNPSGGSDDGVATIFVYQDEDLSLLETLHFYDVWNDE